MILNQPVLGLGRLGTIALTGTLQWFNSPIIGSHSPAFIRLGHWQGLGIGLVAGQVLYPDVDRALTGLGW